MAEIHNGHVSLWRRWSSSSSSSMEEIRDLEVGVAGASGSGRTHQRAAAGVPGVHLLGRRRPSYRTMGSFSPRSNGVVGRFFCEPRSVDEGHHFLDACFLCKKPLGGHCDIFMYRGDTPFCSEECRQEQIDMDEGKEKNWTQLAMKAASSRKEQKPNSTQTIHVRAAGAVVAG